jgi:YD repeat-containing protein
MMYGNLIATTEKGKKQYEYSYDANNRLTIAYQYDINNQSTKYLLSEYSYDPLGRRTTKKLATYKNPTTATGILTLSGYTLSEYLYDGNNLLEESIYSLTTTGTKTLTAKKEYAYKNTNTPTASNTDDIISVLYTTYKTPTKILPQTPTTKKIISVLSSVSRVVPVE